jgi:hypothetical protein
MNAQFEEQLRRAQERMASRTERIEMASKRASPQELRMRTRSAVVRVIALEPEMLSDA